MWFITLIVLALAAFLVIKAVKAQSIRKTAGEEDAAAASGMHDQLKSDSSSQPMAEPQAAANDSGNLDTTPADSVTDDLQASTANPAPSTENRQDELQEIREMIKILNLAESDSGRLGISSEQFNALRAEDSARRDTAAMPSGDAQAEVADRLRRMLA